MQRVCQRLQSDVKPHVQNTPDCLGSVLSRKRCWMSEMRMMGNEKLQIETIAFWIVTLIVIVVLEAGRGEIRRVDVR